MWFLDWSVFSFMVVAIILTISALATANIPVAIAFTISFVVVGLFGSYYSLERAFSLYPQTHYLIAENKGSTLGELWCNYAEFKGELCKDYVEYVLNNQKKDRQVQFEKAQAKQQKLDEEKTHKDTIRANYENLVNELQKGGVK